MKIRNVAALCAIAGLAGIASADDFSLTNGGIINGSTGPAGTATGATDLLSDFRTPTGVGTSTIDHLFEERIFVDPGDGSGVIELTALPRLSEVVTGTTVDVTYDGGSYTVDLSLNYLAADSLSEVITINGLSNLPNFRLWEFTDWDVNGTAGDDTASFNGSDTLSQSDGPFTAAITVSPLPTHWQIGTFADGIPASILGGADLTDTDGGATPGDNAYAFQWNVPVEDGRSFTIDKVKSVVPAPASVAMLGLAGALGISRRRR